MALLLLIDERVFSEMRLCIKNELNSTTSEPVVAKKKQKESRQKEENADQKQDERYPAVDPPDQIQNRHFVCCCSLLRKHCGLYRKGRFSNYGSNRNRHIIYTIL